MTEKDSEKHEAKTTAMSKAPVDRGWAWVVLGAAMFQVFIYGGMMKSYGIFFVEFQRRFGSSASETSIMQTVQNLVVSFSGIFVMNIGLAHMSARTSVWLGTFGMFLVYLGSAYAEDIRILSITIGFFGGLFNTMIFLPIISLIGIYFNARRGLANSMYMSGSSLGGLVLGPVFTYMFENLGYTGTMMIVSAMILNIMISACLMRPIEFFTKHTTGTTLMVDCEKASSGESISEAHLDKKQNGSSHHNDTRLPNLENASEMDHANGTKHGKELSKSKLNGENDLSSGDEEAMTNVTAVSKYDIDAAERQKLMKQVSVPEHKPSQANSPIMLKRLPHMRPVHFTRTVSHDPDIRFHEGGSPTLTRARASTNASLRKRTISEMSHNSALGSVVDSICRSKVALFTSGDVAWGSIIDISSNDNIQASKDNLNNGNSLSKSKIDSANNKKKDSVKSRLTEFLKTQFNVSLLKDPVFIHFLGLAFLSLPASVMSTVYIIPHGKDIGISNQQAGMLLSVVGCVDLISRVCVGIIADKKWLRPNTIVAIAGCVLCVLCNSMRLVTDFWTLLGAVIIQGSLSGTYIALYAVILVENMGLDKFKSCLGFTSMVHGVANGSFFPLTGLLRDATGSYFWTYHMVGVLFLLSAILNITLPITWRWNNARKERDTTGL